MAPFLIYKITNIITQASYIGITKRSIRKRWNAHKAASKGNDTVLYRAMRKYGIEAFKIEPIACCLTYEKLKASEIEIISQEKTLVHQGGYNITKGGDGTLGWVPSKETRGKIRASSTLMMQDLERRKHLSRCAIRQMSSPEMRMKISLANKGKKHTEETRRKVSEAGKNRLKSEETCRKLSIALIGHAVSKETRLKISRAKIGKKMPDGFSEIMSKRLKGKPKSPEHRKAISKAWEKKRIHLRGASPTTNGRWQAFTYKDKRSIYLGRFDSELDAHQAVLKAENGGDLCAE